MKHQCTFWMRNLRQDILFLHGKRSIGWAHVLELLYKKCICINYNQAHDEHFFSTGVGMAMRLIGSKARPSQEITIVDGLWTIKTSTSLKNTHIEFKLDVPFEEQTADGRKVKVPFQNFVCSQVFKNTVFIYLDTDIHWVKYIFNINPI